MASRQQTGGRVKGISPLNPPWQLLLMQCCPSHLRGISPKRGEELMCMWQCANEDGGIELLDLLGGVSRVCLVGFCDGLGGVN